METPASIAVSLIVTRFFICFLLSSAHLNETFYNVTNCSIGDKNISYGNNTIYLIDASAVNGKISKKIEVPASIKNIYFLGKAGKTIELLDITVPNRSSSLKMNFKDFNYYFKDNGIYTDFRSTFNLDITGECSIKPKDSQTLGRYGIYESCY